MVLVANLIATSIGGCRKPAMTDEEFIRRVDERLAERGLTTAPSASASTAAPRASSSSADPANDSNALVAETFSSLARFEDLMKGFEPTLPEVVDKTDMLRCVTSLQSSTDPTLAKASASLVSERAAAEKNREKARKDFLAHVLPLNNRVDYDWSTRGAKSPAIYGCWLHEDNPYSGGSTEFWVEHVSGKVPREADDCDLATRAAYSQGYSAHGTWKIRIPEGAFLFTYSGTEVAPTSPPELMKRVDEAHVVVPERVACRVRDVVLRAEHAIVECRAPAAVRLNHGGLEIHLTGTAPILNIGDVVSVPLRDAHRPAAPVLGLGERGTSKTSAWTVDADATTAKVEETAICPTPAEITSAVTKAAK
jgi:hypothetical protein